MRYVLENDILRVEVSSNGAELKSVKSKATGQEYMWQADPKYWGRTSPILFPFVGRLKNDEYLHDGKKYPMSQHGFARDMEHSLVSITEDTVWFKVMTSHDTLKSFPFSFTLSIGYQLIGNEVKVLWKVCNNSNDKHMHFGIGAHPAFNCPIHGEDSKAGYKLYFGGVNEIRHHGNDRATGLSLDEDICLPLEDGRAVITPEFFDRCTYIVEGNQTGEVGIEDPSGKRFITVLFDAPLFGIWSPEEKNAPFLCIEPWYGRCDSMDFEGTLKERAFDNYLNPGEKFEASYVIRFE